MKNFNWNSIVLPGILLFLAFTSVIAQESLAPGVMDPAHRTFKSYMDVDYNQKLRPQFHFTSRKNWLNDPNGMVYYDGEWHLYFQHNALGLGPGKKSWGHAISTDLVHWEQLPHAILPYSDGAIWSGSAVVDHNNKLGKQVGEIRTLVAYFTKTDKKGFFQAGAYSTDKGRTYTLIKNGKALVPNQGFSKGERDPMVFWDKAKDRYVLVIILGSKKRIIRFFESDNMVDWKKIGDISRKWAAECIDIFQLPVDNDKNNMKWVLADASYDYEVGDFNGDVFVSDTNTSLGDYSDKCFYAAQTFNNAPDGRIVQIGWLKRKKTRKGQQGKKDLFVEAKMPFNQQMSFPTELSLRTTSDGVRLFREPVKEIKNLYVKSHKFNKLTIDSANKAFSDIKPELIDMTIEFEPGEAKNIELLIRGQKVSYGKPVTLRNKKEKIITDGFLLSDKYPLPAQVVNGTVKLRVLLDRASIELFTNDGASVMTDYAVPEMSNRRISIKSDGNIKIKSLVINELKSSWD